MIQASSLLAHLGFSNEDVSKANDYVCGTMTLEGAPFLEKAHLPVFDCANPCGKRVNDIFQLKAISI